MEELKGLARSKEQWIGEIDSELMHLSIQQDKYLVQADMSREGVEKYTEIREKVRRLEAVKKGLKEELI